MAVSNSTDRFNGVVTDKAIKVPCDVATIADITLSGNQTIDGVAVVTDDRVLVRAQTNAVENGIYNVKDSAWERAADWDGNRDITHGTMVYAFNSVNEAVQYIVATDDPIYIGTTAVTIDVYSGGGGGGAGSIEDGTITNAMVRWDGIDTWRQADRIQATVDGANFRIYDTTLTEFLDVSYVGTEAILVLNTASHTFRLDNDLVVSASDLYINGGGVLYQEERSAASGVLAGQGQWWILDDAPNIPMFSDDTGRDFVLTSMRSFDFAFDTDTAATDPGSGQVKFDNSNPALVTNCYINDLAFGGQDSSTILDNLAEGDVLTFVSSVAEGEYIVASVSSAPTDNTGWWTIPLTVIHSGIIFTIGEPMKVSVQWLSQASNSSLTAPVNIVGDTDGVAPLTQTSLLQWVDADESNTFMTMGFTAGNDFFITLSNGSNDIILRNGGSDRIELQGDGRTIISTGNGANNNMFFNVGPNGTDGGISITAGDAVRLFYNDIVTANTIAATQGGLFVNNTYSGSGNERVLTDNDLERGKPFTLYAFSTSTATSAPSNGDFKGNNAVAASVTELYFDDQNNGNQGAENLFCSRVKAGDILTMHEEKLSNNHARFRVTGTATDNTGWWTIPVDYIDGTWPFGNSDLIFIQPQWLSEAPISGGTIGGSITDNQVAVGASTADDIEGGATFTWDNQTLTLGGGGGTRIHMEADGSDPGAETGFGTFFVTDNRWNDTAAAFNDDNGEKWVLQDYNAHHYAFSTITTAADPSTGFFRFDNATLASVTNIYIDDVNQALQDQAKWLSLIQNGDLISITNSSPTKSWIGTVNGTPTDNGGWWTIPVTFVASNGSLFTASSACQIDVQYLSQVTGGGDFSTPVEIIGDINIATPPVSAAYTGELRFVGNDEVETGGSIGFFADGDLIIRNYFRGKTIDIYGATSGGGDARIAAFIHGGTTTDYVKDETAYFQNVRCGTSRTIGFSEEDPPLRVVAADLGASGQVDSNIAFWGSGHIQRYTTGLTTGTLQIQSEGGDVNMNGADDVRMGSSGVAVARTAAAASGGFEANNTLTDDGFNRVLTTGDRANTSTLWYRWESSTTAADPGAGDMRWNNATPASVTEIYINDATFNGQDANPALGTLGVDDVLMIQMDAEFYNDTRYGVFTVTSVTDNTGWWTIGVTAEDVPNLPINTGTVSMSVFKAPAAGGSGNVSNTGTPLNNQLAIWTDATTVEGVAALTYDGSILQVDNDLGIGGTGSLIMFDDREIRMGSGNDMTIDFDGTHGVFNSGSLSGGIQFQDEGVTKIEINTTNSRFEINDGWTILMEETSAAAPGAIAAFAQMWVDDTTTPGNRFAFTCDDGNTAYLGASGLQLDAYTARPYAALTAGNGLIWVDATDDALRYTNGLDQTFAPSVWSELTFYYDSGTTSADPGQDEIRFDSTTPASITEIYWNSTMLATFGINTNHLADLKIGDIITIYRTDNTAQYLRLRVTAAVTDNTGWYTVPVEPMDVGTIFTAGDELRIQFDWAVDKFQNYAIANVASTPTGTTETLTYSEGPAFEVDLESVTGNITITLSGGPTSGDYGQMTVKVTQDSATARTITWAGGTFEWRDGSAHTMNATLDGFSIYTFETWDGGTTWFAAGADYS